MDLDSLIKKMDRLQFHQSLLLEMVANSDDHFYRLIIMKGLNKSEVDHFYQLCDELSDALEEQQAEGFVYFESVFEQFKKALHPKLNPEEVVQACLRQKLYVPLMLEFKKFT